ncbi:MAG: signal recognition particle protein [Alphaproteobacteria bacterium]|nr:signal recognition particle protein [Alphaproteobacteria bacterium]
MFASLSDRLGSIFTGLRKRGALTEDDIDSAMREVRIALLEADVALPVVKEFVKSLKEKAVGTEIIKSVSPAQMVVKLVQDHLTELLGSEHSDLNLNAVPPVVILMTGLQGSGKTTTTGKLAKILREKKSKKVLLASLDVYRPAAQEQLAVLAKQTGVESLPIVAGQMPLDITKRALEEARLGGYDVLLLDTAGRLHIDETLMEELAAVKALSKPTETLLVADSLTGQDAVTIASEFHGKIGVTGIVLTRVDGDSRGGAALSMRHVTGQPIKFMGMGEKLDNLEPFHPSRIASRILDMGDVVSLVERAAEVVDQEQAAAMNARFEEGKFDLNDLANQLQNMKKMGGLGGIMGMLPGMGALKQQLENAPVDEKKFNQIEVILSSMTDKERRDPKILNASRRRRIAIGSGTTVQDINRLIKQWQQMSDMMKQFRKMGKKGLMKNAIKGMMMPRG